MKFYSKLSRYVFRIYLKFFPVNQKILWNLWANFFIEEKEQLAIHPWIDEALDIIVEKKPHRALEVGVGFGRNILELRRRGLDITQFYGIDFSSKMIKLARKRLPEIAKNLEVQNLLTYYPSQSFDLVFVPFVFMHINEDIISDALNNVFNIARTDVIIIDEYIEQNEDFRKINRYTYAHNLKQICANQFPEFTLELFKVYDKWQLLHFRRNNLA